MKFARRWRELSPAEHARLELLARLDEIAITSHGPLAGQIAEHIRRQPRAVDRWVAWAAQQSAVSFGAWVRFDPVVAALARYELVVHGVDLAQVTPTAIAQRRAQDAATDRAQAARQRAEMAPSVAAGRRMERELAQLRAASGGRA